MYREPIDHDPRQIVLAHIGDGSVVDQVRRITGQEHLEEIQPALGTGRSEGRKLVVPDMRAEAVLGFVARTGIVDRDPPRRRQPSAQHVSCLAEEGVLALDEEPHHLPLGDHDADIIEQAHQPRHRDLALHILRNDEALELGAEVANGSGGERGDDRHT